MSRIGKCGHCGLAPWIEGDDPPCDDEICTFPFWESTNTARCDELETVARVTTVFKGIETFAGDFIRGRLKSGDILVTRQNAEEVIAAKDARITEYETGLVQMHQEMSALEADNKRLREALEVMLAPYEGSDCRRDHHGYCQEHFLEEDCCVAEARAALGDVKP